MLYAKYPIQVFASSLYYSYNPENHSVKRVSPKCVNNRHIFGRDFSEKKLIFAVRAEALIRTWYPSHPLTLATREQFLLYNVPEPPMLISPIYQHTFQEIKEEAQLIEWAEDWYSQVATTSTSWLFLRQVISNSGREMPNCFPQATVLEPSYQVDFSPEGFPTNIKLEDGFPLYNFWNNQDNYISIRQVITTFLPEASAVVLHRFLHEEDRDNTLNLLQEVKRRIDPIDQLLPYPPPTPTLPRPPKLRRVKGLIFTSSQIWPHLQSPSSMENLSQEEEEENSEMEELCDNMLDLELGQQPKEESTVDWAEDTGTNNLWEQIIRKTNWEHTSQSSGNATEPPTSIDSEYDSDESGSTMELGTPEEILHGHFNRTDGTITWPTQNLGGTGYWYSSEAGQSSGDNGLSNCYNSLPSTHKTSGDWHNVVMETNQPHSPHTEETTWLKEEKVEETGMEEDSTPSAQQMD